MGNNFGSSASPASIAPVSSNMDPTRTLSPNMDVYLFLELVVIDDDGDGIDNLTDICPGGDDNVDTDSDGTPDFCDATPNGDTIPPDTTIDSASESAI